MLCTRLRPAVLAASLAACGCAIADDGFGDTTGASESSTGESDASTDPTTSASTTGATTSAGTSSASDDGDSTGALDETGAVETGDDTGTTGAGSCVDEFPAIVTDIDATLTISDAEFLTQLANGNYDPVEREGAAELITAYAELGYRILYLTARTETLVSLNTGETARELTERWLLEHDFPTDPATTTLVLAPNLVLGDSAEAFKAETLLMQQAAGWRFDYAYGNATSDIGAYAQAGIALDHTFIIGPEGGMGGTVAIPGEGWVEHTVAYLPIVPAACP